MRKSYFIVNFTIMEIIPLELPLPPLIITATVAVVMIILSSFLYSFFKALFSSMLIVYFKHIFINIICLPLTIIFPHSGCFIALFLFHINDYLIHKTNNLLSLLLSLKLALIILNSFLSLYSFIIYSYVPAGSCFASK